MPIKKENRPLYRTPEWREVCRLVDCRAEGRCERCGVPGGFEVARYYGSTEPNGGRRLMFWQMRSTYGKGPWVTHEGQELKGFYSTALYDGARLAPVRLVSIVLTHAH